MISDEYGHAYINPSRLELRGVKAEVAFDLDGVLCDSGDKLRESVAIHFGYKYGDDILDYDLNHKTGNRYPVFDFKIPLATPGEIRDAIDKVIREESYTWVPNNLVREACAKIHTMMGEPITIVTARHYKNMEVTYKWLKYWLSWNGQPIPFRLIMVYGMQKEVVLKNLEAMYFVDDRYNTIRRLEKCILFPVLYEQPYNQRRPGAAGVCTVKNLMEFYDKIKWRYSK